jgi:hypothetical protein
VFFVVVDVRRHRIRRHRRRLRGLSCRRNRDGDAFPEVFGEERCTMVLGLPDSKSSGHFLILTRNKIKDASVYLLLS